MTTKPVIGIIEWSSDSATEPAVFLGESETQVRRAIAEYLWPLANDGDINYIGSAWIADNPQPDYDDAESVKGWLEELRRETTDAWLTVYNASNSPGSDTYHDLRA